MRRLPACGAWPDRACLSEGTGRGEFSCVIVADRDAARHVNDQLEGGGTGLADAHGGGVEPGSRFEASGSSRLVSAVRGSSRRWPARRWPW